MLKLSFTVASLVVLFNLLDKTGATQAVTVLSMSGAFVLAVISTLMREA